MAGDITTQPKQARQASPMSSLCIILCLWVGFPQIMSQVFYHTAYISEAWSAEVAQLVEIFPNDPWFEGSNWVTPEVSLLNIQA